MSQTTFDFSGRTIAITGSAIGMGESAGKAFAAAGGSVWLLDIDDTRNAAVADAINADGHKATAIHCNVADKSSVLETFAAIEAADGRLDVLINNAGGFWSQHGIEDLEEDEWDKVVNLNLKGVFLCSQAATPMLRASGSGRIITIGSLAGQTAMYRSSPPYAAAKAGAHALSRVLAYELAADGITSNAIAPSAVLTDRILEVRSAEEREKTAASMPMKRYGTPDEIVNVMLFLASDEAGYITGQTIAANGGRFMV